MFSIYTAAYLAVRKFIAAVVLLKQETTNSLYYWYLNALYVLITLYRNVESWRISPPWGLSFQLQSNSIYPKRLGLQSQVSSQSKCALLSLARLISCFISGVGPSASSAYYITRETSLKASVCSRQGAFCIIINEFWEQGCCRKSTSLSKGAKSHE